MHNTSMYRAIKEDSRIEAIAKLLTPKPEYSDGVLIGDWVENRVECPRREQDRWYMPKEKPEKKISKPESRKLDMRVNKIEGRNGSVPVMLSTTAGENCTYNMTSTTDLVYNHLPKIFCKPSARKKFFPRPDHLKCMGNLTEFGLSEDKMREWRCGGVSDYMSTCFQDDYQAPHPNYMLKGKERHYIDSSFTKTFQSLLAKS